jgi:hypothetical protein
VPASQPLPSIELGEIRKRMPDAKWTLFVYMAANTHLAPYARQCFNELRDAGVIPPQLNVMMLITTGDRLKDDPIEWPERSRMVWLPPAGTGGASAYEVDVHRTKLGKDLEVSPILQMHDPQVLGHAMRAIRDAFKTKVILDLWSDGAPRQFIEDSTDTSEASMKASDPGLPKAIHVGRPGVILEDTCGGRSWEILRALGKGSRKAIAVADEASENGFDYVQACTALGDLFKTKGSEVTTQDIAQVFVNTYPGGDEYGDEMFANALSFLNRQLAPELNRLSDILIRGGGLANPDIADCYKQMYRLEDSPDQGDSRDFAQQLLDKGFPASSPIVRAAQKLRDDLTSKDFCLADQSGGLPLALSIYAPLGPIDPSYVPPVEKWLPFLQTKNASAPAQIPDWAKAQPAPPSPPKAPSPPAA